MQLTELPRVDSSSLTPSRRGLRPHGCSRAVLRPPPSQGLLGVTPLDAPVALEHLAVLLTAPHRPVHVDTGRHPRLRSFFPPPCTPTGNHSCSTSQHSESESASAPSPGALSSSLDIPHPRASSRHSDPQPSQEPPSATHRPPQPASWVVITTRSQGPPLSLPTSLFLFS